MKKNHMGQDDSDVSFEKILEESQEGWRRVPDKKSESESIERVNSYINKILDSKKSRRYPRARTRHHYMNIWLIIVFILIFLSFAIILKII